MDKRLCNIDNLRGFVTCLVVLGHVLLGFEGLYNYSGNEELFRVTLFNYIYSFHLPIFFAISGYFFEFDRARTLIDVKKVVLRKFISLMIPYILFSIIYWGIKQILSPFLMNPISMNGLLGIAVWPIEFMWYIYALFFVNCFAEVLVYIIRNKKVIWVISFAMMFLPDVGVPAIYYVKRYMFYFCLGNIVSIVRKKQYKIILCIILGVINQICFWGKFDFAMKYLVVTISGVVFWMLLFLCMDIQTRIPILYRLGVNGMPIYLMHVIAVGGIRILLNRIGIVGFIPNMVMGFVGSLFLCQVMYELVIKKIAVLDFIFYPMRYLHKEKSNKTF